jgi:hypothetical protein
VSAVAVVVPEPPAAAPPVSEELIVVSEPEFEALVESEEVTTGALSEVIVVDEPVTVTDGAGAGSADGLTVEASTVTAAAGAVSCAGAVTSVVGAGAATVGEVVSAGIEAVTVVSLGDEMVESAKWREDTGWLVRGSCEGIDVCEGVGAVGVSVEAGWVASVVVGCAVVSVVVACVVAADVSVLATGAVTGGAVDGDIAVRTPIESSTSGACGCGFAVFGGETRWYMLLTTGTRTCRTTRRRVRVGVAAR